MTKSLLAILFALGIVLPLGCAGTGDKLRPISGSAVLNNDHDGHVHHAHCGHKRQLHGGHWVYHYQGHWEYYDKLSGKWYRYP